VRRRADIASIASGLAVMGLGTLLLLDQAGVLRLRFDYAVPAVLAALGAILLAVGLAGD
jgi:hypothetical protein